MSLAARGVPLYRQIEEDLRDRIRSGDLRPGAQVAPEPDLMAGYGVSRATVRQALAGLIGEGLLEIRRGLGTYVDRAALRAHDRRLLLVQPRDRAARARARDDGPRPAEGAGRRRGRRGARPGRRGRGLRAAAAPPGRPRSARRRDEPSAGDAVPGPRQVDFSQVRLYDTLMHDYGCRPTGRGRRSSRSCRAPTRPTCSGSGAANRHCGSSGSPSTRTTCRSSSAGARFAATGTAIRSSCATDDHVEDLPELPPELDVRRRDRARPGDAARRSDAAQPVASPRGGRPDRGHGRRVVVLPGAGRPRRPEPRSTGPSSRSRSRELCSGPTASCRGAGAARSSARAGHHDLPLRVDLRGRQRRRADPRRRAPDDRGHVPGGQPARRARRRHARLAGRQRGGDVHDALVREHARAAARASSHGRRRRAASRRISARRRTAGREAPRPPRVGRGSGDATGAGS